MWSRIVIQQQNAKIEKPYPLISNHLLQFRQDVTVPRNIEGFQPPKSSSKSKCFFRIQSPEFFLEGFLKLIKWYDKCFNVLGTYVEK
ncbi:hypothetical protein TNCV_3992611 [Trichonephila clavipes]|uniref:Uncharacterized protein n=1 Tax=Trichonephila clavipes TaxID=2585209 RepID=A0A8X6VJM7_TRICX|nr:hypothetical protein TNCV_3992611 [Trichonephila clavipes]